MADALCGPSNALENFQKHTTRDRTLHQDRLLSRHSPARDFRSSLHSNVGVLDSEFEAFQGARPGAGLKNLHSFSHPASVPTSQQLAQASQQPDWAIAFQHLNLSAPSPQAVLYPQPQIASTAVAWHHDFISQQSSGPISQVHTLQQTKYGGTSGHGASAFAGPSFACAPSLHAAPVVEIKSKNQKLQGTDPVFDEAAFEDAFAQAQRDMLDAAKAEHIPIQAHPEALRLTEASRVDPLLERVRETRPAVFSAIQVWSEMGLGRTEEAVSYLDNMWELEQKGHLIQDIDEALWVKDALQNIVLRGAPQEVKTRAGILVDAIAQRLVSDRSLAAQTNASDAQIWKDIEEARYVHVSERNVSEQQPELRQEQPSLKDTDEMAETAGILLEKVADNQSEKFQNSQFFQLMRKLRDRELRVHEDKIVQVNQQDTELAINKASPSSMSELQTGLQHQHSHSAASTATQDFGIDPNILEYAATDWKMPIYSDDEHEQVSTEPKAASIEPVTMAEYEPYLDELVKWDQARCGAATERIQREIQIPKHEQDGDLYRHHEGVGEARRLPGRDPATKARGTPEPVSETFIRGL